MSETKHACTLRFMADVKMIEDGRDVVIASPLGAVQRLKNPGSALRHLLDGLARGGMDRETLCDDALNSSDVAGEFELANLYFVLSGFERKCFVRYTLAPGGRAFATLEPSTRPARFEDFPINERFRLSRFACLRRVDDEMTLECPIGHARMVLHDARGLFLLALLATPKTAVELAVATPSVDAPTIEVFLTLLVSAGAVWACAEHGDISEDKNVPLRQWEFHDLLFHSRSRMGRHRHPFGGTWRFSGALPPLPALKPPMSTQRITLHHPDLQALETSDASFSHVSEARCSVRERGEKTISAAQLGEFLHRSARMKELRAADPENPRSYDVALGPCASGGALHELELYLAVWSCAGLEPGLYHYDPMAHELEHLTGLGPGQRQLLFGACQSSGTETPPDVLINIAARFQRASWKYQSMAYALILKNAGALYQQMYLVATAMNLAPCGLGGGNSDLFAEAANLDYWEETSVGEFMLSGR